ncbi:PRC-barrel domain-containing protein [Sphingomonas sp. LHG3406-1]|uniref:PRC-barrel domain-containing protein n=1 Tax=Sphingomonas sp. LHG3406-1 TaxID=2804617 RepID=UPI00260BAE0D|nr:PRC-barrel domain-containing protein [Sphingomonas sp. LHG3406-1]
MAYDRYPDDDRRERMRDHDRDRDPDRPRDRDRGRGLFSGGHDDRDPGSQRDDRHDRDPRAQERGARSSGQGRNAVQMDETRDLIASHKVEGTAVYGRDDERLGTIKTLMLDKYRGEVRYAVLSQGTGFLGLDEQLFPVQWNELRYDERRNGYRVEFTAEDVRYTLERRERERRQQAHDLDEEYRRRR